MFFILKLFFFPNFLGSQPTEKDKENYVAGELIERGEY